MVEECGGITRRDASGRVVELLEEMTGEGCGNKRRDARGRVVE